MDDANVKTLQLALLDTALRIDKDIENGPVYKLTKQVVENEAFMRWPGSGKADKHHFYRGGLLRHTYEVVRLCLSARVTVAHYPDKVNETDLFLAALYHDTGKVMDYAPVDVAEQEWQYTDHKYLIHHITESALIWRENLQICGISKEFREAHDEPVVHAILSHHGRREWGSPVEPRTPVAWILHNCDSMSARLNDCDK